MGLSTTYTKTETDFLIQQLEKKTSSGYKGDLIKTDAAPTQIGFYGLLETGIYTNLGGIDAQVGKLNFASFDGTTWSLIAVDIPISNFKTIFNPQDNTNGSTDKSIYEYYKNLENSRTNSPIYFKGKNNYINIDISSYLNNGAWINADGTMTTGQDQKFKLYFKIPLEIGKNYTINFTYLGTDANKYYYLYDSSGNLISRTLYSGAQLILNNNQASFISLQKSATTTNATNWSDDISLLKENGSSIDLEKLFYTETSYVPLFQEKETLQDQRFGWTDAVTNPILTDASKYARDATFYYDEASNTIHCFYWTDNNIVYCNAPADTLVFTNKVTKITAEGRPCLLKKDGTYYLYTFKNFKIYLRTFTDFNGTYTTPVEVMTATLSWEDGQIWSPWVIFDNAENLWKMWYTCSFITPVGLSWTEPRRCGYATSTDGITWTKRATPLLEGTNDKSWTDSAIMTLHPIKLGNTYYALLSAGDINGTSRVGVVMSTDGINWDIANSKPINLGSKNEFNSSDMYTGQLLKVKNDLLLFINARQYSNNNCEFTGVYKLGVTTKVDNDKYLITRKDSNNTNQIFSQNLDTVTFSNDFLDTVPYGVADFAPIWLNGLFTDFEINAKVEIKSQKANTGFSFDLRNSAKLSTNNYNGISLDVYAGTTRKSVRLVKYVNSVETVLQENLLFPISTNKKFDVKIKVEGTNYKVYINSVKVIDINDSTYSSGKNGFRAYYGIVDFIIN